MSRYLFLLPRDRSKVLAAVAQAPWGARVEIKASKRTIKQSDKMWAMLGELSEQVVWYGQVLDPESWKLMMLDGLKREVRVVPNIDGNGFVNIGRSSSKLTKQEMSDLIELITAFGAKHDVKFKQDQPAELTEAGAA